MSKPLKRPSGLKVEFCPGCGEYQTLYKSVIPRLDKHRFYKHKNPQTNEICDCGET